MDIVSFYLLINNVVMKLNDICVFLGIMYVILNISIIMDVLNWR